MSNIELLFLGTGTSAGIPMIGCHCPICSSTDPHDNRMRTSAVVTYHGQRILIDTSPELRLQAVAHHVDNIDAIVLTHAHADHIMGLDDVRRYNAIRQAPLDVWADRPTHETVSRCFEYAFNEPDPQSRLFRPHLIRRYIDGPFEIAGLTWHPVPLFHGDMVVQGFRVGRLAYCTDVSRIPEESFPLLQGLDILVLDALQYKRHTTHFTVEQAIEAAQRIQAKQTFFTHIAHALGHEETNQKLPPSMQLAYDGLRVTAAIQ